MRSGIIKKYFWDVDFEKLDKKKDAQYIIARILESGDEKAKQWLFKQYPKAKIKQVLNSSGRVSARSRAYWELILGLWKKKTTKKFSGRKPGVIWRY
ncbi:MAG: hypothetical protein ABH822_02255 [Patescibacteria group bacterium]